MIRPMGVNTAIRMRRVRREGWRTTENARANVALQQTGSSTLGSWVAGKAEEKTYYPAIPANARATSRHLAASRAPATAASNHTAKKAPELNGLDDGDMFGMRRARKVVRWTVTSLGCIEWDSFGEDIPPKRKPDAVPPTPPSILKIFLNNTSACWTLVVSVGWRAS